nr:TD and POZ domain-containing protein 3 [Parasteatoda tepidariorum]
MDIQNQRRVIKSRFRFTARQLRSSTALMNDMQSLLQSGDFSDVRLHCGSDVFRAHKNILSARSPVFAAMFLNPMRESHQDFVEIQGMEPSILRKMLEYIYSSKTEPLNATLACELLSAAYMYQLVGLKMICIDFLRYVMCDENLTLLPLKKNGRRTSGRKIKETNIPTLQAANIDYFYILHNQ